MIDRRHESPAVAAIQFALTAEGGVAFLNCWRVRHHQTRVAGMSRRGVSLWASRASGPCHPWRQRRATGTVGVVMRTLTPIVAMALLLWSVAAAAGVEVFTIAGIPVTHVPDGATVVELDAPARLDHRLSMDLPDDRDAAIRIVKQRLGRLKDDYGAAYHGLLRAWHLGVEQVPAVVVDGTYVVYGQPDVARAIARIREARAQEDGS